MSLLTYEIARDLVASSGTHIVIPNIYTSIDVNAFYNLGPIEAVTIPASITSIGDWAFKGHKLTNIHIPDSVISIGRQAFLGNKIRSIRISSNIDSIGHAAFYSNQLTSVNIPAGITSLSGFGNNKLRTVKIPKSVSEIVGGFGRNALSTIDIPYGVRSIDNAAFSSNLLTSIKIPSSVTAIGYASFANNQLVNATIPQGVITIGPHAFYENNLTAIDLPEGITTIDFMAFANNNITSVKIPKSVTTFGERVFEGNPLTYASISDDSKIDVDLFPEGVLIDRRNVNEYPQDISLSNSSFNEGISHNGDIAILSSKDPDLVDTFEYSLIAGVGDSDNSAFSISGNVLNINESPDYETQSSYSIRVQTKDSGGLIYEKSFTLTVNDLDELTSPAPVPTSIEEDSNNPVRSMEDITTPDEVSTFELKVPIAFGDQSVVDLIVGTAKKDKITGSTSNEVLKGGTGKDVLKGGGGSDGFLFDAKAFGKKTADKILDFNSDEGDSILVDKEVFNLGKKVKLKTVASKKALKKVAKSNNDFVYDEKKGFLYFNENGKEKGWGDGGLFAKLQGAPELGASDFTIV